MELELKIGLPSPVKLLHVTDNIAYDGPEKGRARQQAFDGGIKNQTANYFEQALAYVKEKQIPMLHTGDLIDSLADETFAYIDKKLQDVDYIYAAGNHDYLPLGG